MSLMRYHSTSVSIYKIKNVLSWCLKTSNLSIGLKLFNSKSLQSRKIKNDITAVISFVVPCL